MSLFCDFGGVSASLLVTGVPQDCDRLISSRDLLGSGALEGAHLFPYLEYRFVVHGLRVDFHGFMLHDSPINLTLVFHCGSSQLTT